MWCLILLLCRNRSCGKTDTVPIAGKNFRIEKKLPWSSLCFFISLRQQQLDTSLQSLSAVGILYIPNRKVVLNRPDVLLNIWFIARDLGTNYIIPVYTYSFRKITLYCIKLIMIKYKSDNLILFIMSRPQVIWFIMFDIWVIAHDLCTIYYSHLYVQFPKNNFILH